MRVWFCVWIAKTGRSERLTSTYSSLVLPANNFFPIDAQLFGENVVPIGRKKRAKS